VAAEIQARLKAAAPNWTPVDTFPGQASIVRRPPADASSLPRSRKSSPTSSSRSDRTWRARPARHLLNRTQTPHRPPRTVQKIANRAAERPTLRLPSNRRGLVLIALAASAVRYGGDLLRQSGDERGGHPGAGQAAAPSECRALPGHQQVRHPPSILTPRRRFLAPRHDAHNPPASTADSRRLNSPVPARPLLARPPASSPAASTCKGETRLCCDDALQAICGLNCGTSLGRPRRSHAANSFGAPDSNHAQSRRIAASGPRFVETNKAGPELRHQPRPRLQRAKSQGLVTAAKRHVFSGIGTSSTQRVVPVEHDADPVSILPSQCVQAQRPATSNNSSLSRSWATSSSECAAP